MCLHRSYVHYPIRVHKGLIMFVLAKPHNVLGFTDNKSCSLGIVQLLKKALSTTT